MKTLKYSIRIEASREKVWDILWNDSSYSEWAAAFAEGSTATSDWNEGSEIQFTEASGNGMYGKIVKKIPNRQMTFEHLGQIKAGKKVPFATEDQSFEGAIEDYELKKLDDATTLYVFLETHEDYEAAFNISFPKALKKIKELAEED